MPAPDLSTRQIAILFKDLVHCVFRASGTVFTNNFLSISIFYPALRQQGFPKFMRAGNLSKLEISKTFYTHYTRVASFDFGQIQGQVISIFTPSSHWELFVSVCCPTTYQTDVMNNFFCANILQKEFNLLQMEQVNLWLHPSLDCERFLALWCSLSSPLVASLTSSGLEGILSNYMYLSVQEEGFPVWTSLLLFTVCQTPSVKFDMSNLGPTVTHT